MTAKLATEDDCILAGADETGAIFEGSIPRRATDKPPLGGLQFACGYLSPYFITDPERMEASLGDAYILT